MPESFTSSKFSPSTLQSKSRVKTNCVMDTSKRYGANLVCQGIVGFVPTYATIRLFLPKFEIFIYAPISG